MSSAIIAAADSPEDVAAAKALFVAYQAWLGVDLCFQGFDAEIARFPQGYEVVLLAKLDGAPAGAVGLRALDASACEMKRLYVPEAFQGRGLGRALSVRLMDEARSRGFKLMRLDTLNRLEPAIALYRDLGFAECEAYYNNPVEGVIYMECAL